MHDTYKQDYLAQAERHIAIGAGTYCSAEKDH